MHPEKLLPIWLQRVLLLTASLVLIGVFWSHSHSPTIVLLSESFHTTIEMIFALVSIIAAILIGSYFVIGGITCSIRNTIQTSLLASGLFALLHAILPLENLSTWFLILGGLFSSLILSLMWVKLTDQCSKKIPITMITLVLLISTILIHFPTSLPALRAEEKYTALAVVLSFTCGILYFIAVLKFWIEFKLKNEKEFGIYASIFVVMAFSYFLFPLSHLWSELWWLSHVMRLVSSFIIFGYLTTSMKELQDQIEREKSFLKAIVDHVPSMITVKEVKKWSYVFVNRATEKFYSKTEKEIIGHTSSILLNSEEALKIENNDKQTYYSQKIELEDEIPFTHQNQQYWLKSARVPIAHQYIMCISEDVTDKKNKDEILMRQQMQLTEAARLSALGEMAGGVAHEINNPLTIILAKIEILKKQWKNYSADKIEIELERLEKSGLRIMKIVKGMSALSRNAEQDPKMLVPLSFIIQDTLDICSEKFSNSQILLLVEGDSELDLFVRPTQISQVILNLINNAYDAVSQLPDKWVKIKFQSEKDQALIRVMDSGAGLSEVLQRKIMQPFFTTKEPGKGTGLGLSISRTIIEDHGGRLYHDPTQGHTCFVIQLPLASAEQKAA